MKKRYRSFIFISFVIVSCLLTKLNTVSAQGSWTTKANFPAGGRELPVGFSIGSKGYVGTGGTTPYYDDFWEYDPATNAWTQKANFPGIARFAAVGFSIGNFGYIGTGINFNNASQYFADFWEYDPSTNTWTRKADFGGGIQGAAFGFSIGTKGYIGGGQTGTPTFWEWDQATNVWTQKTNFTPGGRVTGVGLSINGKGYVGTGSGLADMWEYDPALNSWTQKANLPSNGRYDAAGFSICGKGYIGTGESPLTDDLWQFDPVLNTWTQMANLPGPNRDDCPAFAICNRGYFGLGDAANVLTDFYEFTPDTGSSCSCSGVCLTVANFSASDSAFCSEPMQFIDFTDHSTCNPTSWNWTFSGAVPATSTVQNPTNIGYPSSGTFTVELIVSNGVSTDTLTIPGMITVGGTPSAPIITVVGGDTLVCSHASAYQWFVNGNAISGATDSFIVSQMGSTYAVMITDSLGCTRLSSGIILGATEISEGDGVQLYPNPVLDKFTVDFKRPMNNGVIRILNMVGEEIYFETIGNAETKKGIDIGLAKGLYYVMLNSDDRVRILKLVVQ